jgi:hypothetical protein
MVRLHQGAPSKSMGYIVYLNRELDLGVLELAETNTITRFERGESLYPRTVETIRTALETAGVEFIAENGGGAGCGCGIERTRRGE